MSLQKQESIGFLKQGSITVFPDQRPLSTQVQKQEPDSATAFRAFRKVLTATQETR